MIKSTIASIQGLEILDSRGFPTLQVTVTTHDGYQGVSCVPSGASTGSAEALELRDGDPARYFGKGVLKAKQYIQENLSLPLIGFDVFDQKGIDSLLCKEDGTENKSRFGANTILGISLACARAAAAAKKLPLYRSLSPQGPYLLPRPLMNVLNGGVHADNGLPFQEFMVIPKGAPTFSEALRWGTEVYHTLRKILKEQKQVIAVGDEGGFAPRLSSNEEALSLLMQAIEKAGYKPQEQISLALDCAATEFYDQKTKTYLGRSTKEHIAYLQSLCHHFPIDSIEDGLAESDWEGWGELTKTLGDKIQLVGDDLFVTNRKFLEKGIEQKSANAILIKLNQIGTLTETLDCIKMAQDNHMATILSHRSGETEDTTIADLAVATQAGQIKTGAPCRSERNAKYNRLLTIEFELGSQAVYNSSNQ